jgi:hypothetical protein
MAHRRDQGALGRSVNKRLMPHQHPVHTQTDSTHHEMGIALTHNSCVCVRPHTRLRSPLTRCVIAETNRRGETNGARLGGNNVQG